ncbi:arginine repressor [Limnochorda pilosa]|uniref:Arginine repressor n=1 Tax=Limnochorda pilosa TaxID=1555112 RepID=A0A0K2SN37_LIMPI|nr:arginine repressor [Limnochorda pilosa]BAS28417.1 arginine repressor ArgR [Limnochorda pilosa]
MKSRRQATILQLIREREVRTQDELADLLRQAGIEATQATVSRDIKELGLVKEPVPGGGYRYVPSRQEPAGDRLDRARRAFRDFVVSMDVSGNLVLIKTTTGAAHGVAATVDALAWPEVLGSIAGDDTILLVAVERPAGRRSGEPAGDGQAPAASPALLVLQKLQALRSE